MKNIELSTTLGRLSSFNITPNLVLSWVTHLFEKTGRSSDVIVNGLKTILTRLSRKSVEQDIFGLIGTDLSLEGKVIAIKSRWAGLDTERKEKVASLLGGIYQSNLAKALFQ